VTSYRLIETAWTLTIIAVLVAILFALTGCTEAQCIRPIVSIERPILPTVTALELEPISFETYAKLRERDLVLHQYAEQLEMTIREIAEVPGGN